MIFFREKRIESQFQHFLQQHPHFRFSGRLGEGAYGVAYLLEDCTTNTRLVLKRLKAHRLSRKQRYKFQQEIALLQQLQHLPVPRLLDVGTLQHVPFYTMSYVDGETFEQAIFARKVTFTIAQTLHYTEKLLAIVQRMHEASIVHRDLRIPNIIIKDEQLTLIDFGLATKIDPHFSITHIKDPKKTPHPVSDLYAIGHFMLFLLYAQYQPTKKSTSWQQELALALPLQQYIERLLLIGEPFSCAADARHALQQLQKKL